MVEGEAEGLDGRGGSLATAHQHSRVSSIRAADACERAVQVSGGLDDARAAVLVHISAFG